MVAVITQSGNTSTAKLTSTLTPSNTIDSSFTSATIYGLTQVSLTIDSGAHVTGGNSLTIAVGNPGVGIYLGWAIKASQTSNTIITDDGYLVLNNFVSLTNNIHAGVTHYAEVIVQGGGTVELSTFAVPALGQLQFGTDGVGTYKLDAGTTSTIFTEITNVQYGDTFEFVGQTNAAGYVIDDGAVYLVNSNGQELQNTQFTPQFAAGVTGFTFEEIDGNAYLTAICFLPGTRIRAEAGEKAVEDLQPGMLVETADQGLQRVRWVGRSEVSRRFADPARVLPIRIRAGALGENVPSRDLLVSPGHAVFVDGVLAHAGTLVNGLSIVREQNVPTEITYYHVELENHALLISEGAPTESFIDGVEDMRFANWADRVAPEAVEEMAYPRCKSPRQLPRAVRERLAVRARTFLPETIAA